MIGYNKLLVENRKLQKKLELMADRLAVVCLDPNSAEAKLIISSVKQIAKLSKPAKVKWYRRLLNWFGQRSVTVQEAKPAL